MTNIFAARWLTFPDEAARRGFEKENAPNLARDVDDNPVYLAPNKFNLQLTMERWPKVGFHTTREHGQRLAHGLPSESSVAAETEMGGGQGDEGRLFYEAHAYSGR